MSTRATYDQRRRLLDFMQEHRDFATGRVDGPNGSQLKKRLMQELASTLNSFAEGAKKTPDKWMKAWADWRSDVKKKAQRRSNYRKGTGGGPPPPPLSALEHELLDFLGPVAVDGLPVPDTMELSERSRRSSTRSRSRSRSPLAGASGSSSSQVTPNAPAAPELEVTFEEPGGGVAQTGSRDPMISALRIQAEAATKQAAAIERLANVAEHWVTVPERLAAAVERLAAVAEQAERRAAAGPIYYVNEDTSG